MGLVLVGLAFVGVGPTPGADVYRRTLAGTAWVVAADNGKGTGWVVDTRQRLLVTACHVVGDARTVEAIFPVERDGGIVGERAYYLEQLPDLRKSGHAVRGKVVKRQPERDLALIELESLPPGARALALAGNARPGESVHGLGTRYDLDDLWGYTTGSVRQRQVLREGYFHAGQQLAKGADVLLTQSPINEGDSGGPLVNDRGEVVGVAAAVAWEAQGGGLFIDVAAVRALLPAGVGATADKAKDEGPSAVYRQALKSVALVRGGAADHPAAGWVLDRVRRLLLTTASVVGKKPTVEVYFPAFKDGELIADVGHYKEKARHVLGVVLATDVRRNLALVELESIPDDAVALKREAKKVAPGDRLHAITHPPRLEVAWLYTAAAVRQHGKANLGQTKDGLDPAVIVLQAPLAEGDAGGPLLDESGQLVGVISGKVGAQQQLAYALPLAEVEGFLADHRARRQPRTPADRRARAACYLKAKRPDRALAELDAALKLDPRDAKTLAERGRAQLARGKPAEAMDDCSRAIEIDPKQAAAWAQRAAARVALGEADKAIDDADKAIELDAREAAGLLARGQARLLKGELDKALADCDEALWVDRDCGTAHRIRGWVLAARGDLDKALEDFTRAANLDPLDGETLRRRGDVHWAKQDTASALADYDRAVSLNPGDAAAQHGRGRARAARGDRKGALADLDAAVKIDGTLVAAWVDRGEIRLKAGDVDAAVADWRHAVERRPEVAREVVALVQRHVALLDGADPAVAERASMLCERVLETVRPALKGQAVESLDAGLKKASREADAGRRLTVLRETLRALSASSE